MKLSLGVVLFFVVAFGACMSPGPDYEFTGSPKDFGLTPEEVREKNIALQEKLAQTLDALQQRIDVSAAGVRNVYAPYYEDFPNLDGTGTTSTRLYGTVPTSSSTITFDPALIAEWKAWLQERGTDTVFFSSGAPDFMLSVSWQFGNEMLISNGATFEYTTVEKISVAISEGGPREKIEWVFKLRQ